MRNACRQNGRRLHFHGFVRQARVPVPFMRYRVNVKHFDYPYDPRGPMKPHHETARILNGKRLEYPESYIKITYQGKYLEFSERSTVPEIMPKKMCGSKTTFSRASRMNLLKKLARIDWTKSRRSSFLTLTYPSDVRPRDSRTMTQARSTFVRALESHVGRQLVIIWRIEWLTRQLEPFLADWYPHFHFLILDCPYIHWEFLAKRWATALSTRYARVHIEECENEIKAGYYVSKYCAKIDSNSNLVNAVNLNIVPSGRQWGVLRENLMPMCPCKIIYIPDSEIGQTVSDWIVKNRPLNAMAGAGFTILGDGSPEFWKIIAAEWLTGQEDA